MNRAAMSNAAGATGPRVKPGDRPCQFGDRMSDDPPQHRRRSIRLPDYDYAQPGAYFITICTSRRRCLFGEIVDSEMRLNAIGRIVEEEWHRSGEIRREIILDAFVVMPNHIHGIINIGYVTTVGATGGSPLDGPGPGRRSLGSFVAGFKAATTMRINAFRRTPRQPVWQRNYYEHIIREERDLDPIRDYILSNPANWSNDRENPVMGTTLKQLAPWQV